MANELRPVIKRRSTAGTGRTHVTTVRALTGTARVLVPASRVTRVARCHRRPEAR